MATVYIPSMMRKLTAGAQKVEVEGATVRQVIRNLDLMHPGVKGWLVEGHRLKPNISVAVDGTVSSVGLLEPVGKEAEVHFVAAISGGAAGKNGDNQPIRLGLGAFLRGP